MEILECALDRLAGLALETHTGGPNHGPMAAEALFALGHEDLVPGWIEGYARQLSPAPPPIEPIARGDWRTALGERSRFGDWQNYFTKELQNVDWKRLIAIWVPRLLPGGMAAGAHGPIRTAHAVRMVDAVPSEPRVNELATALAYWAAYYQTLPGPPRLTGSSEARAALQRIPHLDQRQQQAGPPPKVVRLLNSLTGFDVVLNAISMPLDAYEGLDELTLAALDMYQMNSHRFPLAFIHTVTTTDAVYTLLPHISEQFHLSGYLFAWQYVAAITAAYGESREQASSEISTVSKPSIDQATTSCLESGDEHSFKLTAACLRLHDRRPESLALAVAHDWSVKMITAQNWDQRRLKSAGLAFH